MDANTHATLLRANQALADARAKIRYEVRRAKSLGVDLPRDYYASLQERVNDAERAYTDALAAAAEPAVARQLRECADELDAVRARIRSEQLHKRLTGISRLPAREWFSLLDKARQLEHQIASAWDSASGAILFNNNAGIKVTPSSSTEED